MERVPDSPFLRARASYDEAGPVLLGVPMDVTISFRPGARFGPARIRAVSEGLETYSPSLERDLEDLAFHDAGSLLLPFGRVEEALALIEDAVGALLDDGHWPFLLGGEHLLTLGAVQAAAQRYPEMAVLQFDAHADQRDTYLGQKLSHATVMRRAGEVLGPERIHQVGIRSGEREEMAWARSRSRLLPSDPAAALPALRALKAELGTRPVYVTVDLDVVDPGFAPGLGTPEPGGWSGADLLAAVRSLAGLNVVGCDLVELSPPYDGPGEASAFLAAKVVREALLALPPG
ncbi:agmatinase [Limnochorda pilosa]|uniref:Agmatinase n=1 Tax=Limnochorda pilosa TaxID=1555112 RepID=A0A0K2SPC2_LIMPI|nr:agmatinase [Limnochorda pilosa]